jgi:hypothetical protein
MASNTYDIQSNYNDILQMKINRILNKKKIDKNTDDIRNIINEI